MQAIKRYQYYIIIGVVSAVALFVMPMLGSEIGLAWKVPNTITGWIVYIISKLFTAAINILIFHCFNMQGLENAKENPNYKEALKLLSEEPSENEWTPKSPEEWKRSVYSKKYILVFSTSILSAVGLTQAVLTFDPISMITYAFTIIMGIVFGVLQMAESEEYWTNEFLRYAQNIKRKVENNDKH